MLPLPSKQGAVWFPLHLLGLQMPGALFWTPALMVHTRARKDAWAQARRGSDNSYNSHSWMS